MTIAIHISAEKNESLFDNFNFNCFSGLALILTSHHFIFIFDRKPDPELTLEANCTPVFCLPQIKNTLILYYWYNFKLPAILERYNADLFIPAGLNCSLRTLIPQLIILDKVTDLKRPGAYLKRFLPDIIKRASALLCCQPAVEDALIKKYPEKHSIRSLHWPVEEAYTQASLGTQNLIKDKFSSGKDFFLCILDKETSAQIILFLKAFSAFKKWQRSNMQLILLCEELPNEKILKEITLYKYRNEIKLLKNNAEHHAQLITSAYALVSIHRGISLPLTALKAMRSGIPVIINDSANNRNVLGEAALYIQLNEKEISSGLILLYKDELARNQFISRGYAISAPFSKENTLQEIWESVRLTAKA